MELRLALIALRIFNPRHWRRRLLQATAAGTVLGWIWARAVWLEPSVRAERDARWAQRSREIKRSMR